MNIILQTENKKRFIDLLLLAGEQESMIGRYLERGELFVLNDNGVKAIYKSCGFELSLRIENFFTDNYDYRMIENDVLLKNMVYLKKQLI